MSKCWKRNEAVYVPLLLCVYLDVEINIMCHCTVWARSYHNYLQMKTRHLGVLVFVALLGLICCRKSFDLWPWLPQAVTPFKNSWFLKMQLNKLSNSVCLCIEVGLLLTHSVEGFLFIVIVLLFSIFIKHTGCWMTGCIICCCFCECIILHRFVVYMLKINLLVGSSVLMVILSVIIFFLFFLSLSLSLSLRDFYFVWVF